MHQLSSFVIKEIWNLCEDKKPQNGDFKAITMNGSMEAFRCVFTMTTDEGFWCSLVLIH